MEIRCPQKTNPIIHKRRNGHKEHLFITDSGKVLTWWEAQTVFMRVQSIYDRMDILQEIDNRVEAGNLTKEQAAYLNGVVDSLARLFRECLESDEEYLWNLLDSIIRNELRRC